MSIFVFLYNLNRSIIKCYLQNLYFKSAINTMLHMKNAIILLYNPHIVEPNINDWYNMSCLQYSFNQPNSYCLKEIYKFNSNNYIYNLLYNIFKHYKIKGYIEVDNKLIVVKTKQSQYIVKNLFDNINNDLSEINEIPMTIFYDTNLLREESNVYFLTVQYFQNSDDDIPITLDIPKTMYLVDNELLTPTFIYRCLKYQGYAFKFNMLYKIKIIDNQIKMIQLDYTKYIVLKKNDYVII